MDPRWGLDTEINWPTDRQAQYNLNLNLISIVIKEFSYYVV
jgi:hypothetical protein